MRENSTFYYLHSDHLGSTVLSTNNGTLDSLQAYYAYGRKRGGSSPPTDNRFTGQKLDTTGLMYYNARYYDPEIGHFISPDTIVPDPTNVLSYNRYMYTYGNPLRYTDPTGHKNCMECVGGGGGGAAIAYAARIALQRAADAAAIGLAVADQANNPPPFNPADPLPALPGTSSHQVESVPGYETQSAASWYDSWLDTPAGPVVGPLPGFATHSPQISDNVLEANATALANTANAALRQLPEELRAATIGASLDSSGGLILSVYGRTSQITTDAIEVLRSKNYTVLDAPQTRTPEFHAERQLYGAEYTIIGISRQAGMCPTCAEFFRDKPEVTVREYIR